MREEIAVENGRISDCQGSWPWRWPWIGSYCISSCVTRRRLPIYQISLKSKKLFVDGRTYGQADGHLRPTVLGRLGGVDLKKVTSSHSLFAQSLAEKQLQLATVVTADWRRNRYYKNTTKFSQCRHLANYNEEQSH